MEAVFGKGGVKAGFTEGRPRKLVLDVARRLIKRGAEAVIAGCTEIPLVLRDEDIPVPLIEPMRIAAQACIIKAGQRLKP
jgi:aspartate racemase